MSYGYGVEKSQEQRNECRKKTIKNRNKLQLLQ